jgi:undecaprenyl-diphosphatase
MPPNHFNKFNTLLISIFSHSGDSLVLYPLLGFCILLLPKTVAVISAVLFSTMASVAIIVWILKVVIRRKRPEGESGALYRKYDPYSFPSGHAARTFAMALTMSHFSVGASILLFLWAIGISADRYRQRLHYGMDIVAGIITGILAALIILGLLIRTDIIGFLENHLPLIS